MRTKIISIAKQIAGAFFLLIFLSFVTASQTKTNDPKETDQVLSAVTESSPSPTPEPTPSPSPETYAVTKVRDGDTIEINYNGKTEAVRLVGIDTPETVDPRKPVQCFGREASDKLKSLLTDSSVTLESDSTQSNKDRYGRLLRFVFVDRQDVGLIMLREGYAQESLYSSVPHKYRDAYLAAQKEAQDNDRGLWSPDACPL